MLEFMPYGQVFRSKLTSFAVEVNDIGDPVLAVDFQALEQADDPDNVKFDNVFTTLETPFTGSVTVSVTDKAMEKYNEGKGLLYSFIKAAGFKNFSPVEVVAGEVPLPDIAGRTVLIACNKLPDDYVAASADGPADPLPEPSYRLMWAVSSGKRTPADDATRKRLAAALNKPKAVKPKADPTKSNDVPF